MGNNQKSGPLKDALYSSITRTSNLEIINMNSIDKMEINEATGGVRRDRNRDSLRRQTLSRVVERRIVSEQQAVNYTPFQTPAYDDFQPIVRAPTEPIQVTQPTASTQPTVRPTARPASIAAGARRARRQGPQPFIQARQARPPRTIGTGLTDTQLLRFYGMPMNRRGLTGLRDGIPLNGKRYRTRKGLVDNLRRYGIQGISTPEQVATAAAINIQRRARDRTAIRDAQTLQDYRRQEQEFFQGNTESVTYELTSSQEIINTLSRYRQRLAMGEKFVIETDNGTAVTLTLANYNDTIARMSTFEDINWDGSDEEVMWSVIQGGSMEIYRIESPTNRGNYTFMEGGFFPYLHDYKDSHLIHTLSRLGCWYEVDQKNYKENCLYLALKDAGVEENILQALSMEFRMRNIAMNKLKEICEKYNLYIQIPQTSNRCLKRFGNPETSINKEPINLSILEAHYFHNFKTDINAFALEHYEEIKDIEEWWKIYRKENGYWKKQDRGMYAKQLLMKIDKKPIEQCTEKIFQTQYFDKFNKTEFSTLEYNEDDVIEMGQPKEKDERPVANYFFDVESVPFGEHIPYVCCFMEESDSQVKTVYGKDCLVGFLESIVSKYGMIPPKKKKKKKAPKGSKKQEKKEEEEDETWYPPEVKILAHNITYDLSFVLEHLCRLNIIEKGVSVVCGSGIYYSKYGMQCVKLMFQVAYKMISMPLQDFGDAFKLKMEKEVMPYQLYTEKFTFENEGMISKKEIKQLGSDIISNGNKKRMIENLEKWKCWNEEKGKYDMIKYSYKYCQIDVRVLRDGWLQFRNSLLDEYNLDAYDFPTISSLSDTFLINQGCYDGVCQLSNIPRQFIANCCRGGRVMCANNKKIHVKGKRINDFDGVSLYPSSMARIDGYLIGRPKIWNSGIDLNQVDGYGLKICVNKVRKRFKFPVVCIKDDDGSNLWTNELEGHELFVDKTTLEDLKKFCNMQDCDYTILQGYYFDEGRNSTVNDVIKKMFNDRKTYKEAGNPLEVAIKLMMNSGYGKCGLKPIDCDVRYISETPEDNNKRFRHFVFNHANKIKQIVKMPNSQWRIELYKQIDTHYNRQHCACEILSTSKRIMNEVMCLAEDNGLEIWYTDTDSIHIADEDISKLADLYRAEYSRELIGKDLGQFHTDFKMENSRKGVKIWAVESIFLGKKTYIDKLVDEDGNTGYHIRMKGIPPKCIDFKVNNMFGGDPVELYKYLYRGEEVCFNMSSGGLACFKTGKNHKVSTVNMKRSVSFR